MMKTKLQFSVNWQKSRPRFVVINKIANEIRVNDKGQQVIENTISSSWVL